jgi:sugar phosphate isomerase/epimerase
MWSLDLSHLFWQGIDIPVAIDSLREAIFHVHAKDIAFNSSNCVKMAYLTARATFGCRSGHGYFVALG